MSIDASFDTAIADQLQRFVFLGFGIEVGAVLVAAVSGMLAARTKRMDLVGTYIVAFVTAFGGGTLRDVLLDRRPLFWANNPVYPVLIFLLSLFFVYTPWIFAPARRFTKPLFNFIDALGLALFSISGTSYALANQMPFFVASLLGVITGVFGGVLRDVLLNEIPMIFRTETSLYATCSFIGCWIFLVSLFLDVHPTTASFLGSATTVAVRMISVHYSITLPPPYCLSNERSKQS